MSRSRSMVRPANRRSRKAAAPRTEGAAATFASVEEKPVRGVKLKHVSTITMVVAFVCLFAYLAGGWTSQPRRRRLDIRGAL